MNKRQLWNYLTKRNSGKSKIKNYDGAEFLNHLTDLMAEELADNNMMHSPTMHLLDHEAIEKAAKIIKKRQKAQPRLINESVENYFKGKKRAAKV